MSWEVFDDFVTHLNTQSSLAKQVAPETSVWGSREKTNIILADIADLLQSINYNLQALGGGKPKKPKPYPRPNSKDKQVKKYGKKPIPLSEIRGWVKNYGKKPPQT